MFDFLKAYEGYLAGRITEKPVTWQEALNLWIEGGIVICKFDIKMCAECPISCGYNRCYLGEANIRLEHDYDFPYPQPKAKICKNMLKQGEWFIEEKERR